MTVADALRNYLTAKLESQPSLQAEKDLLASVNELHNQMKRARLKEELAWTINRRFIDGEHYSKEASQPGKAISQDTSQAKRKLIRRSVPVMEAAIRGLKNFVLKVPLTVEVTPSDGSQAAEQYAKDMGKVWRAIEYELDIPTYLRASCFRPPTVFSR